VINFAQTPQRRREQTLKPRSKVAASDAEGQSADDSLLSVEAAVDDFAKRLWMSLGV
jgi:hypothetical protein